MPVSVCLASQAEPAFRKAQDVPSKGGLVLPREAGSRQLSGMQHMLGQRVATWCRWDTEAMGADGGRGCVPGANAGERTVGLRLVVGTLLA